MTTILDTILKIRNCSMMTRCHHLDSSKARSAEHESVKKKTLDLSSRSKWFSAGLKYYPGNILNLTKGKHIRDGFLNLLTKKILRGMLKCKKRPLIMNFWRDFFLTAGRQEKKFPFSIWVSFCRNRTGKDFANRSKNNVFMAKMNFELGFCISRGDNQCS